jgi:hypothetical protein
MQRDDITTEQARQLHERLYGSLNFLTRLRERMERRGFEPDDELFLLVSDAQDAVFHLRMNLHYLGCRSGVGVALRESQNAESSTTTGESASGSMNQTP